MKIQSLFFNKKIPTPLGIIVILFSALLAGGLLFWQCQIMPKYEIPLIKFPLRPGNQVTITTDKTEYGQGETVRITVKNNLDESIRYDEWTTACRGRTAFSIGKKVDDEYDFYPLSPNKCLMIDEVELQPETARSYELDLSKWETPHIDIDPGVYKWKLIYFLKKNGEIGSKTIYSNEFRIKEREAKTNTSGLSPRFITVSFVNKSSGLERLVFVDSEGKEIERIAGGDSGEIRELDEVISDEWFFEAREDIIVFEKAVESFPGVFYFFIADESLCGTGGCPWVLVKLCSATKHFYTFLRERMTASGVFKDVTVSGWLNDKGYYFSPDKKNLAILYITDCGGCCGSEEIIIIDLEKSIIRRVENPLTEEHRLNYITRFEWLDNDCFEFDLIMNGCEAVEESYNYKYCLSLDKKELITQ